MDKDGSLKSDLRELLEVTVRADPESTPVGDFSRAAVTRRSDDSKRRAVGRQPLACHVINIVLIIDLRRSKYAILCTVVLPE